MSWVTVIWSMTASACLTLSAIYFLVWCRRPTARADLFFSLTALGTAAYAFSELSMILAATPAQFATALRWLQVPTWVVVVSLPGFVLNHLRAGRRWMAWIIFALRTLALLLNFVTGQNLNYREVTALRHTPFLGGTASLGVGVSNPWMLVGQLSLLFLVIFTVDAAIAVWRRGDRRGALLTGGSIVFFSLAGMVQAVLVLWRIVDLPLMASFCFLGIVVAMAYEISREALRAAQLSDDLRESHQRLDLAVRAAKLGLWTWDIARDEIWTTDNGRRLFGLGQSERINFARLMNFLHPDDRALANHAVANLFNGNANFRSEYRIMIPGQPMHWIVARGSVEFNQAGKPVFMRGVSFDITERKRSEEALRESEARFRTVANSAPVLIWMSGADKRCNFFNKGWLDFTGRTLEQELGNGWAEGVHPDDLAGCLKTYVKSFDARQPFTMEYRLRRHDGQYRWISDYGVPRYDSQRNFLGYIGSCVDLTERKQAEEKFRLMAEASPSGIVLADREGRIVLVNARTESLFGYSRAELIGQTLEMLMPERFRSTHAGHRAGFMASPEARAMGAGRELFARRKDGTEFPVEIGLSPIQSEEGMLVLTVIVDITARRQSEGEILQQRNELAHLSRVNMLGELSGSLAHELNQPLTAILSNAQAAVRFLAHPQPDLKEVRDILTDIVSEDKRAGEVIRRLRLLLKKGELQPQLLNANDLVLEVLKLVRSDLVNQGVVAHTELALNPPVLHADRVSLQQVLINLVMNSCDAMAGTTGQDREFTIRTELTGDDWVRVSVSDNGPGIAPDKLEQVFEPFYTTKAHGMGLGLSVCRTIVAAHGGELRAANNPGRGATFCFTLPVGEGESNLKTDH